MTETVDSVVANIPVTHDILPKAASDYMLEQGRRYAAAGGVEVTEDFIRGLYATMTTAARHDEGFRKMQEAHNRFMDGMKAVQAAGGAT